MKKQQPSLVWFRQDLRLSDNPALFHAAKSQTPLILVYILDTEQKNWQPGAASRWWLHHSLQALMLSLEQKYQVTLILQQGKPLDVLNTLIKEHNVQALYWNRCYEPYAITRDTAIKKALQDKEIAVHTFNGALLKEPWEMKNKSKQAFKVFTPFWKTLQQETIREIFPAPSDIKSLKIKGLDLSKFNLLPTLNWDKGFYENWVPGEIAAKDKLKSFLLKSVKNYKLSRDNPSVAATSKLSPHLHFGEISPVQIWHATMTFKAKNAALENNITHFLSELAWREFSTHLLYHFPDLADTSYKPYFNSFPWNNDKKLLKRWQKGLTGYPIVDAGMRELWHTGWMHNRVRMIVASFLIKHLLQPWQKGEAWFWDTLVDADLANNAASWQWVAGSGADAAPYFRIFNPILQGEKFDSDGIYVKKWVPELELLSNKYIHRPWEAPSEVLNKASIIIGKTYPAPIVDHDFARKRALAAFKKLKTVPVTKK